jgi:bifunctional non-homologous end joining protein LigD
MTARTKFQSSIEKAVERQLARYRSKRDFEITSEPRGGARGRGRVQIATTLPFVVQKHAARQLHYDFRLGWNGVLMSWAVAKGPSYFPGDKRLAVQVEDHPMEYGGFEGTIPKGQYGGGTVMVWDFGDWKADGDVDQDLEKGNLKFELHGKKLKGKWALIRMRRNLDHSDKPNWLLIKEKDQFARLESAPAITEEDPDSAVTNRTIDQIAASKDHVWDSKLGLLQQRNHEGSPDSAAEPLPGTPPKRAAITRFLRSAPREEFPGFIEPQLAQQTRSAPNGDDWLHELKLDGYRIQLHVRSTKNRGGNRREVTLLTRKGLDWTARMPDIARAAEQLDAQSAILDGEVVALDDEGRTSFADLQAAFREGKHRSLLYFAFDLLHLDGHNLRALPLTQRKTILAGLLSRIGPDLPLRLSEHIEARGEEVFAKACELGAEGVVSKLATAMYASGRGNTWLKMKCSLEQELVIGGFTLPAKGGRGIGALLLGYYAGGKLRYAGRAGTGFTQQTHRSLRTRLDAIVQKTPAFAEIPREARQHGVWVKPELVAQIAFAAWTRDNLVRQAAFKGLREDKPANEVIREVPVVREVSSSSGPGQRGTTKAMSKEGLGGLQITHPDKVLDEKSGMTKQQLAEYYLAIAEHMLPHIADRPLSVVRCPDGNSKPCFFQKHVGLGLPHGVNSVSIPNRKTGKKEEFLTLNTVEGLLGLAQLGVLEIHPWGSKNNSVETPDRIIFDLDPDKAIPWATLALTAQELRGRLQKLDLTSFLKSTGGKGLHVVVPIEPEHDWPVVKKFAHAVVLRMEEEKPDLYITKMTKAARRNLIYLDYLRNDREATAIAPFSPRARPGVPVAVTLDWKELHGANAPEFHVSDFARWERRLRRDPWGAMDRSKQRLSADVLRAAGVPPGWR